MAAPGDGAHFEQVALMVGLLRVFYRCRLRCAIDVDAVRSDRVQGTARAPTGAYSVLARATRVGAGAAQAGGGDPRAASANASSVSTAFIASRHVVQSGYHGDPVFHRFLFWAVRCGKRCARNMRVQLAIGSKGKHDQSRILLVARGRHRHVVRSRTHRTRGLPKKCHCR